MENELKFKEPKYCARRKYIINKETGAWLHAFPSQNIVMFIDDINIQILTN